MSTQKIAPNETFQFSFVNGMTENGKLKVRFDADNNWLEIELPCDSPLTVNRLYIEKTKDGFSVRSHNHNSPAHPEEEREINCDFGAGYLLDLDLDIDQIKDFGIENKKPVKQENILSNFQAYHNCIKHNDITKANWAEIHENRIIDILKEKLPHGSGIDGKWQFDITEKHIICKNFWHKMNQNGYYCGYINFTVKITGNYRDINGKLDFTITGNFGKNQDIKDYLYETINYCLENL